MKRHVTWTAEERDSLVRKSLELQHERPDLAGLPLIRAAMAVLPIARRRKVTALSQVAWFPIALARELVRQGPLDRDSFTRLVTHDDDPYMALFLEICIASQETLHVLRTIRDEVNTLTTAVRTALIAQSETQ